MEKTCNQDIYDLVAKNNLKLWWVAYALKIHDSNFTRMLRKPISEEKKAEIFEVIEKLGRETKRI